MNTKPKNRTPRGQGDERAKPPVPVITGRRPTKRSRTSHAAAAAAQR